MIYDCEVYAPLTGNLFLYGEPFEVSHLLGMMDGGGVDRALTMAAGYDGSDNETVRRAIEASDRIIGCSYVDPMRGQSAVDEFRMTVEKWGFKGLKLSMVRSDTVYALAEVASDLGTPATIHTNGNAALYPRIADLAERYPDLPVIMEHMGYRYHLDLAVDLAGRFSNLYLGTTVVAAAEPIAVKDAVRRVGAEKVLFGSNAPWAFPLYGVEGIRRLNLSQDEERLVFEGNFHRLYFQ